MEHNVMGSKEPQNKTFYVGDTILWFLKGKKKHIKKFFK
jgi:hypothetical protein